MNHLLEVKVRYNHRKRGDSPVFVNLKKDDETTVQKIQKLQENLRAIVRYYESTPKYLKGYLIDINYNDIIAKTRRISELIIRANQGHSILVDVELQAVKPPEYLYHGTGQKYVESIDRSGLMPKGRLYVHLSGDVDTAVKVGSRHGKAVVYRVSSGRMSRDGHVFYCSVNGVWLIKAVPVEYLEKEQRV